MRARQIVTARYKPTFARVQNRRDLPSRPAEGVKWKCLAPAIDDSSYPYAPWTLTGSLAVLPSLADAS